MASEDFVPERPDLVVYHERALRGIDAAIATRHEAIKSTRTKSLKKLAQLQALIDADTDSDANLHERVGLLSVDVTGQLQDLKVELEGLREEKELHRKFLQALRSAKQREDSKQRSVSVKSPMQQPGLTPVSGQFAAAVPGAMPTRSRHSSASYEYESTQSTEPPRKRTRQTGDFGSHTLPNRERPSVARNDTRIDPSSGLSARNDSGAGVNLMSMNGHDGVDDLRAAATDITASAASARKSAPASVARDILDCTPDSMGFPNTRASQSIPDIGGLADSPSQPAQSASRTADRSQRDGVIHVPIHLDGTKITMAGDLSHLNAIPSVVYFSKGLNGHSSGWYSIGCRNCHTNVDRDNRSWFKSHTSLLTHLKGCQKKATGEARLTSFDELMADYGHMERLEVDDVEYLRLHPYCFPRVREGKWHYPASETPDDIETLGFRARHWMEVARIVRYARNRYEGHEE